MRNGSLLIALLNAAGTGKTKFKSEKKNSCFSAVSDTILQVGFRRPGDNFIEYRSHWENWI